MPIAFMQEFAGTDDTSTTNYDSIAAELEKAGWPEGALVHTAGFASDGTFRIYDVWESNEALEAFMQNTLNPLIEKMLAGRPDAPPPSREDRYELHQAQIGHF